MERESQALSLLPSPVLTLNSITSEEIRDPEVELHGFISDVRPFYAASNVVVVPTQVSAGTNLKVLESMACERAVVSTTSGCAQVLDLNTAGIAHRGRS